jgi:hypothetical protein
LFLKIMDVELYVYDLSRVSKHLNKTSCSITYFET